MRRRGLESERMAVLCCVLVGVLGWGCRPRAIATAETFRYAKLIQPMIEAEDTSRFEELIIEIEQAAETGRMSDAEANQIVKIIMEAESGDWATAKKDAQAVIEAGS